MGWPLAVSAGLMERSSRALVAALWPLTVGHLLAMFVVILPFALLVAFVEWQRPNPDRCQSLGHRVRHFPARQPAPSAGAGADTTDATGALVLCRGDRAWRGTDARADLSRALPGRRPRQGPRGSGRAHKRQSGHGRPGLRRPLCPDDRSRRKLLAWLVYRYLGLKFVSRSWLECSMRHGPSASFWWVLPRSRLALRASTDNECGPLSSRASVSRSHFHGVSAR